MQHSQPHHNHEGPSLNKHAGHHTEDFLRKFWISLILTLIVLIYRESNYLSLILGSVVFFYGGTIFLKGAWRELKARLPGMMSLIGLAICSAYIWSIYAVFVGSETLFWELTSLITIMLLGHWLEMRAVSGAQGALKELSKLLPDKAEVLRAGKTEEVELSELLEGDIVLVRPGAKIPADGVVIGGNSELNESMVTGESRPVSKKINDLVIAGTINGDGALKVKVTSIGEKTFLAGVMRLVREAEASKSRLQILSDKAALYLTVIAISAGAVTLISWLVVGATLDFAFSRLVAVLVVACPHALGLAVPLVAAISTTKAARGGFLVKRRLALEAARTVDTVLFDKTGTLTEGNFSVLSASSEETLSLAASVDAHSEHPIAKAIVREAHEKGVQIKEAKNFRRIAGIGGEAMVDGKKIFVGHRGGPNIQVEVDGRNIGSLEVADKIRNEAREAVKELKSFGKEVVMITGDSEEVARAVSEELGIDKFFARVMPGEKVDKVRALQAQNKVVAMVGDGINDAPALTQADLGVAIGAGTNVAVESAGIILVRNDPRDIAKIIKLSRLTYRKMIQNLFWATGYNVVAIPLAAGALASYGIMLSPAAAAVLMSLSTIIVAVNAMFLRRQKI